MSLVKYGGGVVQMSGSIAGNTFARNRFGNYVRSRTVPVNPNTARQTQVRSIVSQLAQHWNVALSSAERTAWATYAGAVSMLNRLGETVNLTGFNHFIRSNAALLLMGQAIVEAGPTALSLPEKDPTIAVSFDESSKKISVAFDTGLPWLDETGAFLMVEMGQPVLATRNFFGGPWRYAGKVSGNVGVPPTSPQLIDPPFTIIAGQKIFCYFRVVRADGRISEPFYANGTAVT